MPLQPIPSRENRDLLVRYADHYETARFLSGDPSWFMHQVEGSANQEAMAFIASSLSYGSRQQFMSKIRLILDWSQGQPDEWVRAGLFRNHFLAADPHCFYRLFTCAAMHRFLSAYQQLLLTHGTLGHYVQAQATTGLSAVEYICRYFAPCHLSAIIPKDSQSACKRLCMFLRWMVRSGSPVDLGLWAHFIDRRTLIIPLDTHVLRQSVGLGLISSRSATMRTALRLTAVLATIFPDDPLKGDFALFGHGISEAGRK